MATNGETSDPSMDTASDAPNGESNPNEEHKDSAFTAADRIRELLSIDAGVTKIVESAGLAVQALTAQPAVTGEETPLEASKKQFEKCANDYVLASQSVIARLRRQVYALEEANIIAPNPPARETAQNAAPSLPRPGGARAGPAQRTDPPMQITNGGLGRFEVGWLNSRIDKVGPQKEAELWAQARQQLEKMLGESQAGDGGDHGENGHEMELDDER